jgi:hypothetical protein
MGAGGAMAATGGGTETDVSTGAGAGGMTGAVTVRRSSAYSSTSCDDERESGISCDNERESGRSPD